MPRAFKCSVTSTAGARDFEARSLTLINYCRYPYGHCTRSLFARYLLHTHCSEFLFLSLSSTGTLFLLVQTPFEDSGTF